MSPVVSFPSSFARTFSSKRERRLGTRQILPITFSDSWQRTWSKKRFPLLSPHIKKYVLSKHAIGGLFYSHSTQYVEVDCPGKD